MGGQTYSTSRSRLTSVRLCAPSSRTTVMSERPGRQVAGTVSGASQTPFVPLRVTRSPHGVTATARYASEERSRPPHVHPLPPTLAPPPAFLLPFPCSPSIRFPPHFLPAGSARPATPRPPTAPGRCIGRFPNRRNSLLTPVTRC